MKSGECYFVDENNRLCLAESITDETGMTWTIVSVIDEDVLE